jgi:uncharacterized membrane protein
VAPDAIGRVIGIVVAINQFTFAFGPTILAHIEHAEGNYTTALLGCLIMEIFAAAVVLFPVIDPHRRQWRA